MLYRVMFRCTSGRFSVVTDKQPPHLGALPPPSDLHFIASARLWVDLVQPVTSASGTRVSVWLPAEGGWPGAPKTASSVSGTLAGVARAPGLPGPPSAVSRSLPRSP